MVMLGLNGIPQTFTPCRILPAIPPKKFFSARFGDDVIETRRLGYQRFLQRYMF